ncbi:MAG TPA: hypothetical protein VHD83_17230 [Puia sp.]|nr:hypothetical protein [Puia sp.]
MGSAFKNLGAALKGLEKAAARQEKEQQKADAAKTVARYNQLMIDLVSLHKEAPKPFDWKNIVNEPAPTEPVPQHRHEQKALHRERNYKPSALDKIFKLTAKRTARLAREVVEAKKRDSIEFEKLKREYDKKHASWQTLHTMASGVLQYEAVAYRDAIAHFSPFEGIKGLGTKIEFTFEEEEYVMADLQVSGKDIIPDKIYSLTSTGKLSTKKMPVSQFNELYQDFICSCALRVGREILAFLPLRKIVVNAVSDIVNPATGRREDHVILSVAISAEMIKEINFQAIDPSDCMENFVHNMRWSKTAGFSPVEKLSAM